MPAPGIVRRKITKKVLFFDTGQNHEEWFRKALPQWDVPFIVDWLRAHTSFREIVPLGIDTDARPPYDRNYRRTLFVPPPGPTSEQAQAVAAALPPRP